MIVMKFGGTSNQDAAAMRNVIRIVKKYEDQHPVVVISAIAQATNELERTARLGAQGRGEEAASVVTGLFERHYMIVDNLITSSDRRRRLEEEFHNYLTEIKAIVKGLTILRELTPRSMDAVCSYGERLCSQIIAVGLEENGVASAWVNARDFMITDDHFGQARPLVDEVSARVERTLRPLLDLGKTPVTQGFIGATREGVYTTMGRESSDYSASIIAASMGADRVQIWTDVDGILTADPRIVDKTRLIEHMSFGEAFELSFFGAKVLHPNTMLPALESDIPVQILNSKQEVRPGTLVDPDGEPGDSVPSVIKSITYKNDLAVVNVTPRMRLNQYLFWEGIYSVLARRGMNAAIASTSEFSIALAVEKRFLDDGFSDELEQLGSVQIFRGVGSICLVGKGMRGHAGIADRVFRSLPGMNIRMISYGASDMSMTFIVEEHQLHDAVKRLHREFFETLP